MENKSTIKRVIRSGPATIVFWEDGTKTVVKCAEGDEYDPNVGLLVACVKKACGNSHVGMENTLREHWVGNKLINEIAEKVAKALRQVANVLASLGAKNSW